MIVKQVIINLILPLINMYVYIIFFLNFYFFLNFTSKNTFLLARAAHRLMDQLISPPPLLPRQKRDMSCARVASVVPRQ